MKTSRATQAQSSDTCIITLSNIVINLQSLCCNTSIDASQIFYQ